MGRDKDKNISTVGLRLRAEAKLKAVVSEPDFSRTASENKRLLHELQVHQLELEMQNSEMRQARDEVETALEKHNDLFELAPVGYFSLDDNGNITAVNLSGASLLGIERGKLLGCRFMQLFEQEYCSTLHAFLNTAFTTQGKETCEVALLKEGKRAHFVQIETMATASDQGCCLVMIDIADRRLTEEMLKESENRYRVIIDNVPAIVYHYSIKHGGRFYSPQIEKVFGLPLQAFYDNPHLWNESIHPDNVCVVENAIKIIGVDGECGFDIEYRVCNRLGEWIWLRDNIIHREEMDGDEVIFGIAKDITVHRRNEEELRSYANRLVEMEESLRKRLATELHDEIGRDLTALGINLAIISDGLPHAAKNSLNSRMEESAKLLKDVTLTVRGVMSGLRPPVLDDYGLMATLRWHAALFSKRASLAATVQADDCCPRLAAEKELVFFRIYQEAVINIAKHAAARNVLISIDDSNGIFRLTVTDDGKGFAPAACSHMQPHAGWGMTIMRERAESIGGHIHVNSVPGKGTVVSVHLPLEDI